MPHQSSCCLDNNNNTTITNGTTTPPATNSTAQHSANELQHLTRTVEDCGWMEREITCVKQRRANWRRQCQIGQEKGDSWLTNRLSFFGKQDHRLDMRENAIVTLDGRRGFLWTQKTLGKSRCLGARNNRIRINNPLKQHYAVF